MWYVNINRNVIDSNRKHGKNDPPIRIQKGKHGKPTYGFSAVLPEGSRLVYSNDGAILPCGARLVIISEKEPRLE
jgi:hypothetical protein